MDQVLARQQWLEDCNHEAEVQGVGNWHHCKLYFAVTQREDREVEVLDQRRASPIHLLDEPPNSVIDYKVVVLLSKVHSEVVLAVKQSGVVDRSEFLHFYVFEKSSVEFRPLFLNQVNNCRLGEVLTNEFRLHGLSAWQIEYRSGRSFFRICSIFFLI